MRSILTFSGSSLNLMRSGEEGTIQRISSPFVQELQQLGIYPGMEVKVIRSHSSVVLQSGNTYFRLDPFQTRAIYVRLSNPLCVYPNL